MSTSPPSNQQLVFGSLVFTLGALFLLVHLAGIARIAYDVLVLGVPTNLIVKLLIINLVFFFGLGLSTISQRRYDNPAFPQFARVYTWVYMTVITLTYLGITLRLGTYDYSALLYGAFFALIVAELIAAFSLRLAVSKQNFGVFAIPMLAIVLFHLLLIVYQYVFAAAPVSIFLLADLLFFFFMAVVSSALAGQNAFRAVIERVIEKVG